MTFYFLLFNKIQNTASVYPFSPFRSPPHNFPSFSISCGLWIMYKLTYFPIHVVLYIYISHFLLMYTHTHYIKHSLLPTQNPRLPIYIYIFNNIRISKYSLRWKIGSSQSHFDLLLWFLLIIHLIISLISIFFTYKFIVFN